MSRDDGFMIADVSTGMLDDLKVKALWRELAPDDGRMAHAMTLYTATLLASWHHGCRVTVEEAAPLWLGVDGELVAALVRAKLLDRSRRLVPASWHHWFDPAVERREKRRQSGRLGGLKAAGKPRKSDAKATPKRRSSDAAPDRPKDGLDIARPSPRGGALESAAAPRGESATFEDIRQQLKRNGTLPVKDRAGLLSEPMTADESAEIPVEATA